MEKVPRPLPKRTAQLQNYFTLEPRGITTRSPADVIEGGAAKSASAVPKSNWLCLISASNMPRITIKTNREPGCGADPQSSNSKASDFDLVQLDTLCSYCPWV